MALLGPPCPVHDYTKVRVPVRLGGTTVMACPCGATDAAAAKQAREWADQWGSSLLVRCGECGDYIDESRWWDPAARAVPHCPCCCSPIPTSDDDRPVPEIDGATGTILRQREES